MSVSAKLRRVSHRTAGLALAGTLAVGLAGVAGPALAGGGSAGVAMAGLTMSTHGARVGNTPGWYDGRTVTFTYSKNFVCRMPPVSHARSRCEAGSLYDRIPAATFDPLYVIVPVGFSPARRTLNCPTAGRCIDHPHTIDLSQVFGSAKYDNVLLPPHSHIITTTNSSQPEWWPVVVVGVTNEATWHKIVEAKSYAELNRLRSSGDTHITNNIPTNLFLYFKVTSSPSS
jgi:hypothetical protein